MSDSHKVMTALILVAFVFVWKLTKQVPSNCQCGVFSAIIDM